MAEKIPFILDTDTAQDDCVAILLGAMSQRAEMLGITMVAGNVGFERQIQNAQLTLNVMGKLGQIPIFLGCSQPMLRPWASAENVHGDGSGGLTMDFDAATAEDEHAVDALLRLTAERPGEVSVVAIGQYCYGDCEGPPVCEERQEPLHHGWFEQRARQYYAFCGVQFLCGPGGCPDCVHCWL